MRRQSARDDGPSRTSRLQNSHLGIPGEVIEMCAESRNVVERQRVVALRSRQVYRRDRPFDRQSRTAFAHVLVSPGFVCENR
jgi:hypothetical protein